MLSENLREIEMRLQRATAKRGASLKDVTLVAVSKNVNVEAIQNACELGIKNFGENRVQEALPKTESLPSSIFWHFVGHLQTNKIKFVLPVFKLIHSLDSFKLACALQNEGLKRDLIVDALLQVNIASEKSKFGFQPEEVQDALEEIAGFSNVRVLGLMTIAPFLSNPEEARPYFRLLNRSFKNINIPGVKMEYLSMGMTNDFEIAVEEGSNMVRLGTALFGERN